MSKASSFSNTPKNVNGIANQSESKQPSSQRIGFSAPPVVVQRYKTQSGKKITDNDNYFVDQSTTNLLYAEQSATAPASGSLIVTTGNTVNYASATYDEYEFDTGKIFVNDCLGFAENVARDTDTDSNRAEFRAVNDKPTGTDRLFGQSDSQNTSIANGSWAEDEDTDPGIGEAYAITRTVDPVNGETPYHVAAVIAKDGTDNVTIEADASDIGRTVPVFDMYGTVPPGSRATSKKNSLTFYETYKDGYTSKRGKKTKKTKHAPSAGTLRLRTD